MVTVFEILLLFPAATDVGGEQDVVAHPDLVGVLLLPPEYPPRPSPPWRD